MYLLSFLRGSGESLPRCFEAQGKLLLSLPDDYLFRSTSDPKLCRIFRIAFQLNDLIEKADILGCHRDFHGSDSTGRYGLFRIFHRGATASGACGNDNQRLITRILYLEKLFLAVAHLQGSQIGLDGAYLARCYQFVLFFVGRIVGLRQPLEIQASDLRTMHRIADHQDLIVFI